LRLISGVVREDEGVDVFRGNMGGDREDARPVGAWSGWGVDGLFGIGGAWKVDIRFARLASVGLTVLAPSPVAWDAAVGIPGMTDIRLAEDDGVDVPRPLGLPGDLVANEADLVWSGVIVGVERRAGPCLAGG
jgi:hypothetical protein